MEFLRRMHHCDLDLELPLIYRVKGNQGWKTNSIGKLDLHFQVELHNK